MLESDRRFYARCVRFMVECIVPHLIHEPANLIRNGQTIALPTPYFYHDHQSDYERLAGCLEALSLLRPLIDPPGQACCFDLAYGPIEAEKIAYEHALEGPTLPHLLAILFNFVGEKIGMSCEVGVMFVGDYASTIMPHLCEHGFAAREPQGYVWLPKFRNIYDLNFI